MDPISPTNSAEEPHCEQLTLQFAICILQLFCFGCTPPWDTYFDLAKVSALGFTATAALGDCGLAKYSPTCSTMLAAAG